MFRLNVVNLYIPPLSKRREDIPLDEQEHDYIQWVLKETNGNQTLAAQILGIGRVSLWRKLKRFELEKG